MLQNHGILRSLQTIDTTPDGFSPVETTDTKQTRLVVQEPGKSRLKTER